jgi:hypothetical protein
VHQELIAQSRNLGIRQNRHRAAFIDAFTAGEILIDEAIATEWAQLGMAERLISDALSRHSLLDKLKIHLPTLWSPMEDREKDILEKIYRLSAMRNRIVHAGQKVDKNEMTEVLMTVEAIEEIVRRRKAAHAESSPN